MITTLKKPDKVSFSNNPIVFEINTTLTSAHKVKATINLYSDTKEKSLVFQYEVFQSTDEAGNVSFDFQSYIHAYFQQVDSNFNLSQFDNGSLIKSQLFGSLTVNFLVLDINNRPRESAQKWGYYIINGSTNKSTEYLLQHIQDKSVLLSFAPTLSISKLSGVFVSYFNRTKQTVKLCATFTFAEGVKKTTWLSQHDLEAGVYDVYISYDQLTGAAIEPFTTVDIYIRDAFNNNLSNQQTWLNDTSNQTLDRTVIFKNSIGGWDSIRLLGESEAKLKFTREATESNSLKKTSSITTERHYNIETGFLAATYENVELARNWIANDLGRSSKMYLKTPSELLEVRLLNEEILTSKDFDFLASIKLEFEAIRLINSFTHPELVMPPNDLTEEQYFNEGYLNKGYI